MIPTPRDNTDSMLVVEARAVHQMKDYVSLIMCLTSTDDCFFLQVAIVRTRPVSGKKYNGGGAWMSVEEIPKTNNNQYSAGQMKIQRSPDTIEVGWMVSDRFFALYFVTKPLPSYSKHRLTIYDLVCFIKNPKKLKPLGESVIYYLYLYSNVFFFRNIR